MGDLRALFPVDFRGRALRRLGSPAAHRLTGALTADHGGCRRRDSLNLSVWFATHVIFTDLETVTPGRVSLLVPVWSSLDTAALTLTAVAAALIWGLRLDCSRCCRSWRWPVLA